MKNYTVINDGKKVMCCPCEGKGWLNTPATICSQCNGEGKIKDNHYIYVDEQNKIAIDSDCGA